MGGQVVNVHTPIATGLDADGYREISGRVHGRGRSAWPPPCGARRLRPPWSAAGHPQRPSGPKAGDRHSPAGRRTIEVRRPLHPQPAAPEPRMVGASVGTPVRSILARPDRQAIRVRCADVVGTFRTSPPSSVSSAPCSSSSAMPGRSHTAIRESGPAERDSDAWP